MTASIPDAVRALADLQSLRHDLYDDIDLGVLDGFRRPAPPFPLELLGTRWSSWVANAAEGSGSPVDYVACGLLAVVAGTVGNAFRVSPWSSWSEPSVLWVCLVGDPSSGKSPALDPLRTAVAQIEARWAREFSSELQNWEEDAAIAKAVREMWDGEVKRSVKANKKPPSMPLDAIPPPEPGLPRLRVSDATPEALAAVLASNPRGVLLVRDELAGWLGGFGRYTGAAAGERALWIEAFGARAHTIDRVKTGSLRIQHLAVSMLGTTQPARLHRLLLSAEDDGLAARFLWCWPEPTPPSRPAVEADVSVLETALDWLRELPMPNDEPTILMLAEDAADLFHTWRIEHEDTVRSAAGMLASAFGKADGLILRLALVLELLDAAGAKAEMPKHVSKTAVARGVALWTDYFAPMIRRTFGDAALPERDRDATTLARWIARDRPAIINGRNLRRHVRLPGLTESTRVKAALEVLVEARWLEASPSRRGNTPGRQKGDFRVRNALFESLDSRGARP